MKGDGTYKRNGKTYHSNLPTYGQHLRTNGDMIRSLDHDGMVRLVTGIMNGCESCHEKGTESCGECEGFRVRLEDWLWKDRDGLTGETKLRTYSDTELARYICAKVDGKCARCPVLCGVKGKGAKDSCPSRGASGMRKPMAHTGCLSSITDWVRSKAK